MNLIKELNEALDLEMQELNEEVLAYTDNCLFILESSASSTCETAICFLTKIATDIKNKHFDKMNRQAKHRFAILAALSLLRKKQHSIEKITDTPSIRKYMSSAPDSSQDDLDEVQKIMTRILGKLKSEHNESGTQYKEHLIKLYSEDPDSLHATVVKLKKRYQQLKSKI